MTTSESTEQAAESTWRSVRWLYPIMFLLGVLLVGLLLVVQNLSSTVDQLDDKVTRVDAQVEELGAFVDQLQQPPSGDEQARNEAISAAVRLVPEIKTILCEQFPQATACNVP